MAKNTQDPTWLDKYSSKIPPVIIMLGSGAWKVVEIVSNIDFIISIRNETFRTWFNAFDDFGWWVLIVGGVIWMVNPVKSKRRRVLTPALLVSAVVIAFLWGVLLTVRATGQIPNMFVKWGSG